MSVKNSTGNEWSAERGEKWRAHAAGMGAMLAPLDEPLIRALQLDAPYRIADLGCGGGGTTLEIARRAPTGSVVHGFDISPALIEAARASIGSDRQNVAFEVADVATAAIPGEFYDRLASRFGLMFFADPDVAFANLAGWLAPGGRFAFAVWGLPQENPWMTAVRDVVAEIVDLPPTDPEGPGLFRYGNSAVLLSQLDRAGFSDLQVDTWRGTLPIGGGLVPAEAARFALASFSTFGEALMKGGDEAMQKAHRSLTERFSRSLHDAYVRMDAAVHIVTGMRG